MLWSRHFPPRCLVPGLLCTAVMLKPCMCLQSPCLPLWSAMVLRRDWILAIAFSVPLAALQGSVAVTL